MIATSTLCASIKRAPTNVPANRDFTVMEESVAMGN